MVYYSLRDQSRFDENYFSSLCRFKTKINVLLHHTKESFIAFILIKILFIHWQGTFELSRNFRPFQSNLFVDVHLFFLSAVKRHFLHSFDFYFYFHSSLLLFYESIAGNLDKPSGEGNRKRRMRLDETRVAHCGWMGGNEKAGVKET